LVLKLGTLWTSDLDWLFRVVDICCVVVTRKGTAMSLANLSGLFISIWSFGADAIFTDRLALEDDGMSENVFGGGQEDVDVDTRLELLAIAFPAVIWEGASVFSLLTWLWDSLYPARHNVPDPHSYTAGSCQNLSKRSENHHSHYSLLVGH